MAKIGRPSGSNSIFGNKLLSLRGNENISTFINKLKVSPAAYATYINGAKTISAEKLWNFALEYAAANNRKMIDLNWLMDDNDRRPGPIFVGETTNAVAEPPTKTISALPEPNALDRLSAPPKSRRMKPRPAKISSGEWWQNDIQTWDVRGQAAANSQRGVEVIDTGYADDNIAPPEGLTLVAAEGDSMKPVILGGQYVMIDKTREGFEVDGGIVVVVTMDDNGKFETRIKRCYRKGKDYLFTSINKDGHESFTVAAANCRIWPVIGVWFAGKGRPPREG